MSEKKKSKRVEETNKSQSWGPLCVCFLPLAGARTRKWLLSRIGPYSVCWVIISEVPLAVVVVRERWALFLLSFLHRHHCSTPVCQLYRSNFISQLELFLRCLGGRSSSLTHLSEQLIVWLGKKTQDIGGLFHWSLALGSLFDLLAPDFLLCRQRRSMGTRGRGDWWCCLGGGGRVKHTAHLVLLALTWLQSCALTTEALAAAGQFIAGLGRKWRNVRTIIVHWLYVRFTL